MLKSALAGVGLAFAALAGEASAQQQRPPQGEPPFAVQEVALPPAEALRNTQLLNAALTGLPPQRPGVVDTYVLVASLWDDPVFEREAREAAAILGRHFDASDRTIILSAGTGPGSARTYPTSDPNSIQAALARIGQVADPREDLVVVFLTSHGAPNGMVAMQERQRLQGGIMPRHLRASLVAAGIARKVAIISACFSGNFILPMGDADTVVLTAAAADKTSFGCQPNREWTYFGDAFFNHAMRSGAPLLQGYDSALNIITGWEDKLISDYDALPASRRTLNNPRPEHSNPISHVGQNMTPLVEAAEAYGVAVGCAANLSFAYDRARTGRPLRGLTDAAAIQAAKGRAEARAQQLATQRGRAAIDATRVIATETTGIPAIFQAQADEITARAAACRETYGAAG